MRFMTVSPCSDCIANVESVGFWYHELHLQRRKVGNADTDSCV
jgi:hypothetical protein